MAELEPLFDPAPESGAQPLGYRQGTVIAFDQVTGANTIQVGLSQFSNLPLLGVAEAATLVAGSVVGIMSTGREYAILGRFVRPNTPEYTDAVNRLSNGTQSQTVDTGEITTSTTYTDLATPGPTVTVNVKSSGRAVVFISASILPIDDQAGAVGGEMGIEVRDSAGGVIFTAASLPALSTEYTDNATHTLGDKMAATRTVLLSGLAAGAYTLTAKYKAGASGNTANFASRNLTTIAL